MGREVIIRVGGVDYSEVAPLGQRRLIPEKGAKRKTC
jgi:hypothetical protein